MEEHGLKLEGLATIEPCGSRVTCNPPPLDTDADFLVETEAGHKLALVVGELSGNSFVWEGSEHYQAIAGDGFMSWRRGNVNMIVTSNPHWAKRHRLATALCKKLNLMQKSERVAVFQAILYDNVEAS